MTFWATCAPQHVVALGESQSAMFLTTYINAVDPLAQVYDGFLVHSRFGSAAPLDDSSIFEEQQISTPQAVDIPYRPARPTRRDHHRNRPFRRRATWLLLRKAA